MISVSSVLIHHSWNDSIFITHFLIFWYLSMSILPNIILMTIEHQQSCKNTNVFWRSMYHNLISFSLSSIVICTNKLCKLPHELRCLTLYTSSFVLPSVERWRSLRESRSCVSKEGMLFDCCRPWMYDWEQHWNLSTINQSLELLLFIASVVHNAELWVSVNHWLVINNLQWIDIFCGCQELH